jgi:RNA polymerase sigma-70 factor (ECF subfamily)
MVGEQWRTSATGSPEAQVLDRETALVALRGCSATDREALLLTAWDGLSADEAGLVLHCSARAFTVRLHRARARFDRLYRAAESDVVPPEATDTPRATTPRLDACSPAEELS